MGQVPGLLRSENQNQNQKLGSFAMLLNLRKGHSLLWCSRNIIVAAMAISLSIGGSAWGQSNGVLREIWGGLTGGSLLSLTNATGNFQTPPDSNEVITAYFEAHSNIGENFGDRYRALLIPPMTGSYVFWVQGDDASALALSSDESPSNRVQIAINLTTALYRAWYTYPSQQSSNIFLEAGKKYFIEAIRKAGAGDDAFAVGWKLPNGVYEQPIPDSRLWVYGLPAVSKPVLTSNPTSATVLEGSKAVFRVGISNFDAVTYQWQRNGTSLPLPGGASLILPSVLPSDNASTFRCIIANSFGSVTSVTAVLTVTSDTTAPVLSDAANLSTNMVQVTFSEPISSATATNKANYSLNNGAVVTAAAFGSSSRIVLLSVSNMLLNGSYTLAVNNIRDTAVAQNLIAANSQKTFSALLKGVYREVFTGIPGSLLADLTNTAVYPNAPTTAEVLTDYLETVPYPTNNVGQRFRAYVVPPVSGTYTFWIAAHDSATLSLGSSALPSSAQVIASVTRSGDVAAREWEIQANQKSALINLTAGQQYYLEVLMKSGISIGFPPDHLAVRWQLPDGTLEEPISVARFVPAGMNLPLFTQQPAGATVIEGMPITFSVKVSNLEPVFYQWQQNGTNVPGATNANYTKSSALLAESNSIIRCVVWNALGTANSANATLYVNRDITPPDIASVDNNGLTKVAVYFNEPVEAVSGVNIANYSIPGITISAATLSADGRTVTLTTSPLTLGNSYTLTVNNVRDRAATPNTIYLNTQWIFVATEFFVDGIGTPPTGSSAYVPGGVNITAGSGDFSGVSDSLNFTYKQMVGDFDVRVRVARLDFADALTVAALMVRKDLSTGSVYSAVCTTPSVSGTFFQYRTNVATVPAETGFYPANTPYTWLRLQRTGGATFNGYASVDGLTWTKLGTINLSGLSSTMYLGFYVSSHNETNTTYAEFRDFGNNTSTAQGFPPSNVEPPGPSSRRTGLVISEIMYHPAPRLDARKIEFIELYNSNPTPEDISGYRISGDVSYTFPPGTVLAGGAFLVIARSPGDINAVYGIPNVVGPYNNNLSNKSGTVRLRNRQNAILLEIKYDSEIPWPITPDGSGHSLVLARPSFGENDPRSWSQSDAKGGSPGRIDGIGYDPARTVVINEFLAHTDFPELDYVELYNHSTAPVDLSGCWLSDDLTTNKFRIPNGTIIGPTGFVYFTETTLGIGFSTLGEYIFLVNSNNTRVVDSLKFDPQENGVSSGRVPDGGPSFHRLAAKTPGAPNGATRTKNIVINEIMYHPITDNDADEFVEIYNRASTNVNLSGWRIKGGIDFTFPSNTVIVSNSYIVVAKDILRLRSNYANLNLTNSFGNYTGALGNGGDRVKIDMPDTTVTTNLAGFAETNLIHIDIDEVTYGTGGKWGEWSDGGGSSLELIDPHSNNRLPSNWADSDDSSKSSFTTLSVSGLLDNAGGSPSDWDAIQIYLLDQGECLVDNVNLTVDGVVFMSSSINNGGFESQLTGWSAQGDHRYSFIENSGASGSRSLHVVAQDRGDTGANRINYPFITKYTTNVSGTISAAVKWLRGRPEILIRIRGNHLELAGVMNVPKNLGTPGARNSRYSTNSGPAITDVVHRPILPAANEPVVVTAYVTDPDPLTTVQLIFRVDPFGSTFTSNMVDNGTGGDAIAGDGIYTATIPGISGQPNNDMVAFYIQATDAGSPVKTTRFPALTSAVNRGTTTPECLIRFAESQPLTTFGTYRFWMTDTTLGDWLTHEKFSSENYKGTFVYGNHRVIYNAASHYAGSPAHAKLYDSPIGTNCDYQLMLPKDDMLLNTDSIRVQEPGLFGADKTGQNEQFAYWLINQLGLPSLNRRSVNVFVNGLRRGLIYEDTQRQNADWDEQWFPDANHDLDDLYRVGYWYEFPDDVNGRSDNIPSLQPFTTTGGVKKLARYRQTFQKRAVKDSPHNYTNLFGLVDAMNSNPNTVGGDAYAAQVFPVVDVKAWARAFAAERVINNTDLYGALRLNGSETKPGAQNSFLFKPGGDSWKFLIWDVDAAFLGTAVDPLFDFTDPPISNMFTHPYVLRCYWQALEDAATGPLRRENMFPPMDEKYAAYLSVNLPVNSPQGMKDFLETRRDYILQLLSENRADFKITSSNGNNFTSGSTLATLTGVAPFSARTITINGIAYTLSWSSVSNWTARVPLTSQTNLLTVRAYDSSSNLLAGGTQNITVYFNGLVARAEDSLAINEILFQPAVTNADFVEIYNRSTNTTFGLAGYRLKGADFDFPADSIINPQSYLVVIKDTNAFRAAYGNGPQIVGQFSGELDNDGETLQLVRVSTVTNQPDTIISKVKYEIVAPWPSAPAATNGGVSLQLIDSSKDHGRVSNWDDGIGWRFFSYTATAPGNTLSLWLSAAAEIYIDDIRLVQGSVAAVGANLVVNGDFETSLSGPWSFPNSYLGNTVITNRYSKSGTNSLRFAPTKTGSSSTAMTQDVSPTPSGTYTVSFWYKPSSAANVDLTVRLESSSFQNTIGVNTIKATPGTSNSTAGTVNSYPLVWINEVQPINIGTLLDNTGTNSPWIELYNSGTNTIDLSGLSLARSYTNLNEWTFPAGTVLLPNQFRIIFVDGRPQYTSNSVLHTSFRLDPTNGSIVLSRTNQIIDYINYIGLGADVSYGSYPDGQLFDRQLFYFVTPGASNNPAPVPVAINEWMASNTGTIQNPANQNKFDDWFELYNFGASTVDLSGFYLTQDFNNKTMWRIPNGTTIAPHGFLFVWADDDQTGTNTANNALHTNFKLSKSGDSIGLYGPQGTKVHTVTFGAQANNVSQGLYLDGNVSGSYYTMTIPTPRTNNTVSGNVFAPVLAQPINRVVNEGALLSFTVTATDGDVPAQTISYSLVNAPEGALVNASSGLFTWTPTELQGPGVYSITVVAADNGSPAQSDSKSFEVTVNESNLAPSIGGISEQSTYADSLLSVGIPVSDPDVPAQSFSYALLSGPAGAAVSGAGVFSWTPSAAQAPSTNVVVVKATDSGSPALSATQSFVVVVNAGTACGGLKGDVTPRGAPDFAVGATDWVLIGRFYAGLSTPSNACEIARADCAPRTTCGDGVIGATDWVQAGRYYAGLDQLKLMDCSPAPAPDSMAAKSLKAKRWVASNGSTEVFADGHRPTGMKVDAGRVISITNTTLIRGTTNKFFFILNSQGDENALGFSIHFDTNLLTFVSARRGADAADAPQFLVNTSELSQGLVGIGLLLPTDTAFEAGARRIVEVSFRASAGSESLSTPLSFGGSPVAFEVSDPLANPLAISFADGEATLASDRDLLFQRIVQLNAPQPAGVLLQGLGAAGRWEIQGSTNLTDWLPLSVVTNVTGQVEFIDSSAPPSQRFYRALKLN